MEERGQGDHRVDHEKCGKDPYDDGRYRFWDELIEKQEKRVAVPDGGGAEECPQQSVLKADVSVKIPFFVRIIHHLCRFRRSRILPVYHSVTVASIPASDQQKDRIIGQVGKSDLHNNCSDSVDRAERTGGKSTVGETPVFDRSDHGLDHPAKEGINEKEPEKFCKCKSHSYLV